MDKKELSFTRRALYHPSAGKIKLVNNLIESMKSYAKGVEITDITFKEGTLMLGGLSVKRIEIDPHEVGGVLVHWYPNYKVSTKSDPFCSAYILSLSELRKLISRVDELVLKKS